MDPILNTNAERLIPIAEPWLGGEEASAVRQTVVDNWISQGPLVKEFEHQMALCTGKNYGSACNSGTTALHLALHICDIQPGNEVIIPNLTMIALANAVLLAGATPVFVDADVNSDVGNISLEGIKEKISAKTKAIILVHTYGEPVEDIVEIIDHCKGMDIKIIEDCAESHFGKLDNKMLGSFGDLSVFSFYSNKNITTGEGGMVTTNKLYEKERLDRVRMHAFTPGQHFCHTERAFGYRMTDMQAAIGLEQLKKSTKFMERRRYIRRMYDEGLKDLHHMNIPKMAEGSANWVMPLITMSNDDRDNLRHYLAHYGIESRTYFQPMHQQYFLTKYSNGDYPVSETLSECGLYIPLYPKLTDDDVKYIIEVLQQERI